MTAIKKLLVLCLIWTTGIVVWAADVPTDEIWYYASSQLTEVNDDYNAGLRLGAFKAADGTSLTVTHTFSAGKGVLKFSGDVGIIGQDAFHNSNITGIDIPSTVKKIEGSAFSGCKSLQSIDLTNVLEFGMFAFSNNTALKSITINATYIYDDPYSSSFYGCENIEELVWGSSLSPKLVTQYCKNKLKKVTIGKNVTSILPGAFEGCSNINYFVVNWDEPIDVSNGALDGIYKSDATLQVNAGWTEDYASAPVWQNFGNIVSYEIRYEADGKLPETTSNFNGGLKTDAFNCTITSHLFKNGTGVIHFGEKVTSIGDFAFNKSYGLTSIEIPNSVKSIGTAAFQYCEKLVSITIPNSVTSIGSSAFAHCTKITSITIPNSVTSIEDYAFSECSRLTSITIPNSVTSIGSNAFASCRSLTSITIPNSVASIGDDAFYGCSELTSIEIPNSVKSIGNYAFSSCM